MEAGKATMLNNLFEFDQRQVGRVMIPRSAVQVLDLEKDPDHNMSIIRDSGHSRFPVINGGLDNIVGIVLSKDLYAAILAGETEPWKQLRQYARKPLVIPETQRVAKLFETMRIHRAHMALVVDEYGELAGIITLEDLLEEIVGEIEDETDSAEHPRPIEEHEGHWVAHGLATLTDVERLVGLTVPDELDANTLSGLFMQRLGRMPEMGDIISEGGFELRVDALDGRRVGVAHISRLETKEESGTDTDDSDTATGKEVTE
jgi:CBS domain containing-hemolysin-like protein